MIITHTNDKHILQLDVCKRKTITLPVLYGKENVVFHSSILNFRFVVVELCYVNVLLQNRIQIYLMLTPLQFL